MRPRALRPLHEARLVQERRVRAPAERVRVVLRGHGHDAPLALQLGNDGTVRVLHVLADEVGDRLGQPPVGVHWARQLVALLHDACRPQLLHRHDNIVFQHNGSCVMNA